MRKFNLILANAAMAAALLFTSCKPDDEEEAEPAAPSVLLQSSTDGAITEDATVEPGSTLTFRVELVKGDANLDEFKFFQGSSGLSADEFWIDGEDVDSNPFSVDNQGDEFVLTVNASSEETTTLYQFQVTDKDGVVGSTSVNITTEEVEVTTALGSDASFKWARVGGNDATGLDALGLKWTSNSATAAIVKTDAATKLVKLTDSYASITTVEDLKTKVDAASEITQYDGVATGSGATYNDVLGVINGGKYYLINVTSSKVFSTKAGTEIDIEGVYKTAPATEMVATAAK